MSLGDILLALRRRWVVVLAVTLLTVAAAIAFTQRAEKRYESTATVALLPNTKTSQGAALSADTFSILLGNFAARAASSVTITRAQANLGRPLPGKVEVTTEAGSGLLRFRATATDPKDARTTTDAVMNAFLADVQRSPLVEGETIQPPSLSSAAYWPKPILTAVIALLVGFGLGGAAAVAADRLRRRIEAPDDAASLVQAPIVGRLPRERSVGRLDEPLSWDSPALLPLHASLRALRANVEHASANGSSPAPAVGVSRTGRVILISSATARQGKSFLTAGLGLAFAQVDVETVILDADIYRPRQHELFGVSDAESGLNQLLTGQEALSEFDLCPTLHDRLTLLPAGPAVPAASDLLPSRIGAILAELKHRAAIVLIDSPPVLDVSDAKVIASRASDLLLVTSSGSERPSELGRAVREFALVGSEVSGLVINRLGTPEQISSYAYPGTSSDRSA
jgi:capsular exopolysaccharide synthesis family protein